MKLDSIVVQKLLEEMFNSKLTEQKYKMIKDEFSFEERGEIDVKSYGKMKTWFLIS